MRRFTILILPTQQRRGRMGWEFGVRVRLEALDWTGLEGQGLRVLFSGRALHVNLVAAEMPRLRLEAGEQAPQVLRVQEARVAVPFAPKCSCPVQGKLQRYNFWRMQSRHILAGSGRVLSVPESWLTISQ